MMNISYQYISTLYQQCILQSKKIVNALHKKLFYKQIKERTRIQNIKESDEPVDIVNKVFANVYSQYIRTSHKKCR